MGGGGSVAIRGLLLVLTPFDRASAVYTGTVCVCWAGVNKRLALQLHLPIN